MAERALEGIRVLDFTWVLAGPIMTRSLAYHGAEVYRVETTKRLDPVLPYFATNAETHIGKRSIGLNVAHPEGRKLFERLVKISDLVCDNYAAGVMERLGFTYENLSKINPRLIQLTMPAMGSTGPHKGDVTFGPNLHAVGGLDHLTGYPDATPGGIGVAFADYAAPGHAIVSILAALEYRDRTGKGQWIDLAQFESLATCLGPDMLAWQIDGVNPIRSGNRVNNQAPYGCYPCRGNDRWCVIAVSNQDEWGALCAAMGKPALVNDTRFATITARLKNLDALDKVISEWTSQHTAYDVMMTLQRGDVPAGMVQDIPEFVVDPHIEARGFLTKDMKDHWFGKVTCGGMQVRLSDTPGQATGPAPYMGEHNDHVFGTLLGLSEAERKRLASEGVIETTMPDQYMVPPNLKAALGKK
ncbi:MAG: CoA transferase [Chloroflexi bacterium]|nr:CoA transferase [Chloroflexota bacterium]